MRKIFSTFLLFGCLCGVVKWTSGRVLIVPHEYIEVCTKEHTNNTFEAFDYANFEIILENDTHAILNGSFESNVDFEKISGEIFAEHQIGSKWVIEGFNRRYDDFCKTNFDPLQPTYPYTRHFPRCPVKKGSSYIFDMVSLVFPEHLLEAAPPHYWGAWRGTILFTTLSNGTGILNCVRFYADIYEDTRKRTSTLANVMGGK